MGRISDCASGNAGHTLLGAAVSEVVLTPNWQPVVVRYSPAGFSTLDFNAYVPGAPLGTRFYADDDAVVPPQRARAARRVPRLTPR